MIYYQEMWNCPYSNDSFPVYAEDIDAGVEASPSTAMLAEVARKKKVTIVAGSIPERSCGNLYNTCCVFDKNGELKAKFRKVLKPHAVFNLIFNGLHAYGQRNNGVNALGVARFIFLTLIYPERLHSKSLTR